MRLRIGIDNGADGAIVALDENRRVVLSVNNPSVDVGATRTRRNPKPGETKMRKGTKRVPDLPGMLSLMRELLTVPLWEAGKDYDVFAVLEHAQAMPKQGSASTFEYARFYMAWEMALVCFGVPYQIVTPKRWQQSILRDVPGADTKARAITKAGSVLPGLARAGKAQQRTGLADAGCMALYAGELRPMSPSRLRIPPPPSRR